MVIDEIEKTDQWMQAHPQEAAQQLSDATGLPLSIWQTSISRQVYGVQPVNQKIVDAQQSIADVFYSLGLLPAKEKVARAVWRPAVK